MTEHGHQPRQPGRSGRSRVPQEPRKTGWQVLDAFDDRAEPDSDVPPWAVPGGIEPIRPVRRHQRIGEPEQIDAPAPAVGPVRGDADLGEPASRGRKPGRSRAARARRRRSKRRVLTWGAVAVVIAVVVVAGIVLTRSPAPRSPFVSTLQKGELRTVPDVCKVVGATLLQQYLGGTPTSIQPFGDPAQSQCTYTVDAKPTFRVLNISAQAYRWSLVPVGNGGATANASYTFAQQRRLLANPPKHTPQPAATITPVSGLGDQALSAVQVFHVGGGSVTDRVTVLVRYHNVLVSVYLQGQANGGFGPVSISDLRAGALAAASGVLAQLRREPTVG